MLCYFGWSNLGEYTATLLLSLFLQSNFLCLYTFLFPIIFSLAVFTVSSNIPEHQFISSLQLFSIFKRNSVKEKCFYLLIYSKPFIFPSAFSHRLSVFYKVQLNGLCLLQILRQLWVFFNILFYSPKMFNFEFVTVDTNVVHTNPNTKCRPVVRRCARGGCS